MKKLVVTCLVTVAAAAAFAGPDWQAIEHARKAKAAPQVIAVVEGQAATSAECPPAPLVLRPDHGPRPQVSPAHNRALRQRHEDALQRCTLTAR